MLDYWQPDAICGETDTEGIAANAPVSPVVLGIFLDPVCYSYKNVVADCVTKDIVHHFKVFDIEVGDGIGNVLFVDNLVLDDIEKVLLGEQSRELVVGGFVDFLLLPMDFLGVVQDCQERTDFFVVGVCHIMSFEIEVPGILA